MLSVLFLILRGLVLNREMALKPHISKTALSMLLKDKFIAMFVFSAGRWSFVANQITQIVEMDLI